MQFGWRSSQSRLVLCLAAVVALLVGSPDAISAGRRHKPADTLSSPPLVFKSGKPFVARVKLRTFKAHTLRLYLTPTGRPGPGARRLGVIRLHGRQGKLRARLPRRLSQGVYLLAACAGRKRCVVAGGPLIVLGGKPHPVNARVTLDAPRAARATIGPAGGSVEATDAKGTTYRLDIAKNSLTGPKQITVTPASRIGGRGALAHALGGVQFAPEGLMLVHGGTLTIVPRHKKRLSKLTAFAWDGTGQNAHGVVAAPRAGRLVIPIAHFSGAGAGSGADPGPAPAGDDAIYQVMIGRIFRDYLSDQINGFAAADSMDKVLDNWLAHLKAVDLPPALDDDTAAFATIKKLFALARTSELVAGRYGACLYSSQSHCRFTSGLEYLLTSRTDRVIPIVNKILEAAYTRAQHHCSDEHDLSWVSQIVSIDREEMILSNGGHGSQTDFQCLRFQVKIDNTNTYTYLYEPGQLNYQFSTTIPLQFQAAGDLTVSGQASVAEQASGSTTDSSGCTLSITGVVPGSWKITNLDGSTLNRRGIDPETGQPYPPGSDPTHVFLHWRVVPGDLNPSPPQETYTYSGCKQNPTFNDAFGAVDLAIGAQQYVQQNGSNIDLVLPLDYHPGSATIGTLQFPESASDPGNYTISGNTTVTVTHTPQRYAG